MILDAAEAVFADHSFAGTSLRMVAQRAGVTTALINYYFGTKFKLYEEVYLRQAANIAQARLDGLRRIEETGEISDARAIVREFVLPIVRMRQTEAGRSFLRLQWMVETEPKEISYKLRGKAYDESTHAYAAALHRALPHLSLEQTYARLAIVIGANLYASSSRHRLDELVPELTAERGTELILTEIMSFVAGAMAEDRNG